MRNFYVWRYTSLPDRRFGTSFGGKSLRISSETMLKQRQRRHLSRTSLSVSHP
ncbi:MAG: hypothetical protein WBD58_11825 [Geitlerinemataceae cyanobacterium]